MRVEVEESDAERLRVLTGEGTVAAAIRNLAKEEKKDIYITYPRDGGTKTVTAGEMVIDLLAGRVKLPDNTMEYTSTSLEAHRFKWAGSILFETDKDVVIRLEETGGKWTIDAGTWLPIVHQRFQKVYVTILEDTKIRFWASTHPEGALRIVRGILTIEKQDLVLADSTTTVLGGGGVYTGDSFSTDGYAKIVGTAYSDQASAADPTAENGEN